MELIKDFNSLVISPIVEEIEEQKTFLEWMADFTFKRKKVDIYTRLGHIYISRYYPNLKRKDPFYLQRKREIKQILINITLNNLRRVYNGF